MNDDDDGIELDALDRAALERAIAMTLAEDDQASVEQVKDMLANPGRTWWETATFCAYHQQGRNLRIKPWEYTPCWIEPDEIDAIVARGQDRQKYGAAKLLKRMLACGLSEFDPTPLESLAAVERTAAK
jgi:hypothetical protein